MTVLLFGKDGQVGFELQRSLARLGSVHAAGSRDCNLIDAASLRSFIREAKPQLIVNAAAYTAVDNAESDLDRARAVNATALAIMGEEGARLSAPVISYSTDYVFDGAKSAPYTERDRTAPLNVYGQTKLEGELALAHSNPRHVVMRTSWVAGAHGRNFVKTVLQLAEERNVLRVVADQHGAPTGAMLLADVTANIVSRLIRDGRENFPFGLYHVTAGGETTWYEFARFVVAAGVAAGKPILATPDKIERITTADYAAPARRPLNSRLDTTLFKDTFGLRLPPWQEGISDMLMQLL